jgi:hypothetical protein
MSFSEALRSYELAFQAESTALFVDTVVAVKESIVLGSPITSSPGQPVQTGNLRASWTEEFIDAHHARVTTNVVYAQPIEDGIGPHGPLVLRSEVGGFGSVAKTVAGFLRLLDQVARTRGGR